MFIVFKFKTIKSFKTHLKAEKKLFKVKKHLVRRNSNHYNYAILYAIFISMHLCSRENRENMSRLLIMGENIEAVLTGSLGDEAQQCYFSMVRRNFKDEVRLKIIEI